MGSMWRSERMCLCDMYMPPEAAFDIFAYLGEMEIIQVVDMTPDIPLYGRHFVAEVCRYDAMERKLYYLYGEMLKDNIVEVWDSSNPKPMTQHEVTDFEAELEKWELDIRNTEEYQTNILKDYTKLKLYFYVLVEIGPILGNAVLNTKLASMGEGDKPDPQLTVLTGVVPRHLCFNFELMLWRISRGNMYYRQANNDEITMDANSRKPLRMVAFIAVCNGAQLRARFEKVCTGFRVMEFPCPQTAEERDEMARSLFVRIEDMEQVLKKTNFHKCKMLRIISRHWHNWIQRTKKAKAIYHCLNLFSLDITNKCMIGQCWLAEKEIPMIQQYLFDVSKELGCNAPAFIQKVKTHQEPPTFHRTNKFTNGFQNLINAYGDSTYRELNPGLYTIVTFPFLFSVMFGDMGHGLIMFIFAMFMVLNEKKFMLAKIESEIWSIFFQGRYIILMMSIFSVCSGFIYNDVFSKMMVLTKPFWVNHYNDTAIRSWKDLTLDPRAKHHKPYIYGLDPAWMYGKNKIMSQNSVKMKFSVIIGIIHMQFGIMLGLFNHLHFKEYHAIFFELIPQMIFMTCLFFWLVLMIYIKWFTYYAGAADPTHEVGCAPLLLILFIDMSLMQTSKPVYHDCNAYLFPWEPVLEKFLLFTSLLMIPIMLFATPIYLKRVHKRKRREIVRKINAIRKKKKRRRYVYEKTENVLLSSLETCSRGLAEMLISEDIHTVEFVLSTVSHTASYLRLWALSLAHSQLSEMLWLMVMMKNGLIQNHAYAMFNIFLAFGLWAILTVAILVVMEGLSAFLHTLRLHWVEFMSKFFQGAGIPFEPFSFREILEIGESRPENICKIVGASTQADLFYEDTIIQQEL